MMPYGKRCKVGLIIAVFVGTALFNDPAMSQDAAWDGLINAGRNALQQRDFSEAERHFEAALEAAERFPSGDERLGKSYNNLAAVYYAQEDYARAEPLMRRALAQLRESRGPENTEVAQTMKNLAALYFLQGNRTEAEALLKQSLTILEKVHGPNHAFVATVLSNLAGLYQAENRFQDAEPLLTRSLKIWEGLLGAEHPDVVRSRDLLAKVRQAQGGEQSASGTAVAQPSGPRPLIVPGDAATDDDSAPGSQNARELAKAAEALEQLTKSTVAEVANRSTSSNVPAPPLNPIKRLAEIELDPASPDEDDQPRPLAEAIKVDDTASLPNGIATLPSEPAPNLEDKAVAILDSAPSADEVSFSVYLSTLWSIDEARRYWQAMQDALPEILENKKMEIEEVAATGGSDPFYRVLTAPFPSDAAAQAVCEEIRSKLRTHDCNVVVRGNTADG